MRFLNEIHDEKQSKYQICSEDMHKMWSKSFFYSFICIFLSGCIPIDRVPFPTKIDNKTNTFSTGLLSHEKVTSIELFEVSPQGHKIVWKIRAESPYPSKDFLVKLCIVPQGFIQEIPNSEETFLLVSGYEYLLIIRSDIAYPAKIKFIAD